MKATKYPRKYSSDSKLKINIDKTNSLIFNKSGRLIKTETVHCEVYMIEPGNLIRLKWKI